MSALQPQARESRTPLSIWRTTPPGRASVLRIAQEVARLHGVALTDITGPKHCKALWVARRAVYGACRDAGFSFLQIGRRLDRDHSTIVKVLRRAAA